MPKKSNIPPVEWLSARIMWDKRNDPNFVYKSVDFYNSFRFKNIVASVGEYVLVSNADSAEPDAEEGCDAAQILTLYESHDNDLEDRYRARVLWFSKPADLPPSQWSNVDNISFDNKEVIEDHRPFDVDVSIETFFKKCNIIRGSSSLDAHEVLLSNESNLLTFACRYRLTPINRRKFTIEPVLVEERMALQLLRTPVSKKSTPKTTTPGSITRRLSRVSISEQKSWSVANTDGTKLMLKRAILTDNINKEKETPRKNTPLKKIIETETKDNSESKDTPRRKILLSDDISNILSMELEEVSDQELPTLIIRQHAPTTPKRKTSNYATSVNNKFDIEERIDSPSGRATRSSRKPVYYNENNDNSPIKQTPNKESHKILKSVRKRLLSDSDEDFSMIPRTPNRRASTLNTPNRALAASNTPSRKASTANTPSGKAAHTNTPSHKLAASNTPKRSVKKIVSQLTPSLQSRTHSVEKDDWDKENKELPGREQQMEEILSFVRAKLLDRSSGCMYISGVPGTGKTATVWAAMRSLQEEPGLPTFQLLEVNGMRVAEPRQAYVHIYRQLTGKTVAWEQACSLLEKRFTQAGPRRSPTVLLVDELDALCTRRQDVVYSIMEWAARDSARLSVLAVANTMDLPERALAARVASRLGLTRLTFPPYTHTQLQKIVATRLSDTNVTPDAVQLIARKVAAVSGDARRALSLCNRALELGRAAGTGAGLREVERALNEAASGAAVRAIRCLSPAERLMLRAVASEVERTGSDETTLSRVLYTAAALASLEGRGYKSASRVRAPTTSQALAICSSLASSRLLLLEPKANEPRLLLNISADDVHYATRQVSM